MSAPMESLQAQLDKLIAQWRAEVGTDGGTDYSEYRRAVNDATTDCADDLASLLARVRFTLAAPQERKPRDEWRLDDRGCLDDVVVEDVETFRLERMGDDHIWGAVYRRDGSRTVFNIYGDRVSLTHEDDVPAPAETRQSPDYNERVKQLRSAVYIGSGVQLSERVLAVILAHQDSPLAAPQETTPDLIANVNQALNRAGASHLIAVRSLTGELEAVAAPALAAPAPQEDEGKEAILAYRAEVARLKTIGLNQYGECPKCNHSFDPNISGAAPAETRQPPAEDRMSKGNEHWMAPKSIAFFLRNLAGEIEKGVAGAVPEQLREAAIRVDLLGTPETPPRPDIEISESVLMDVEARIFYAATSVKALAESARLLRTKLNGLRAASVPPETPRPDLRALIAKWRSFAAEADRRDVETGRGSYAICATELEAALSVESVPVNSQPDPTLYLLRTLLLDCLDITSDGTLACRHCNAGIEVAKNLPVPHEDGCVVGQIQIMLKSVESVPPAPKPPTETK